MRKKNKLELLFPNGKIPEVHAFNRSLDAMSKEVRRKYREKIYRVSFIVWTALTPSQKDFIVAVIIHDRQAYVDFIHQKTVMKRIRYTFRYPTLFIHALRLLEGLERTGRNPLSHLAMSVSICFNLPGKVKTLAEKIRKVKPTPEELLILSGKTEIKDDYNG